MIPFEKEITDQIKEAMKAKQSVRLEALRSMKSALKYKVAEAEGDSLTEQQCLEVFQKLVKQRNESIEQFEKAGRQEQADKEKEELEVIQSFLPKAFTPDELATLVDEAITSTGAKEPKDMGLVMKALKEKTTGRADGKTLSQLVKDKLAALG